MPHHPSAKGKDSLKSWCPRPQSPIGTSIQAVTEGVAGEAAIAPEGRQGDEQPGCAGKEPSPRIEPAHIPAGSALHPLEARDTVCRARLMPPGSSQRCPESCREPWDGSPGAERVSGLWGAAPEHRRASIPELLGVEHERGGDGHQGDGTEPRFYLRTAKHPPIGHDRGVLGALS